MNVKDAEIHHDQASGRQAASERVENSHGDLATQPIWIPGKAAEARLTAVSQERGS